MEVLEYSGTLNKATYIEVALDKCVEQTCFTTLPVSYHW